MAAINKEQQAWDAFAQNHLTPLAAGGENIVLHGQLHPGVYPSDRERFERSKREGVPAAEMAKLAYFRYVKDMTSQGVPIRRLRVLPPEGMHGYDEEDITLMREWVRVGQNAGEDVRLAYFSDIKDGLQEVCGKDSPLVQDYLWGVMEQVPRAGFWSVRHRRATGGLALQAIRLMDYAPGSSVADTTVYTPPFDEDMQRFERFWYDLSERAEPL